MELSAKTPNPPYYAVIFTSLRNDVDIGYDKMNIITWEKVHEIDGYLGAESFRDSNGFGVTIAYFKDRLSINDWKHQKDHLVAQKKGKELWYDHYKVRICKVEYDYEFNRR